MSSPEPKKKVVVRLPREEPPPPPKVKKIIRLPREEPVTEAMAPPPPPEIKEAPSARTVLTNNVLTKGDIIHKQGSGLLDADSARIEIKNLRGMSGGGSEPKPLTGGGGGSEPKKSMMKRPMKIIFEQDPGPSRATLKRLQLIENTKIAHRIAEQRKAEERKKERAEHALYMQTPEYQIQRAKERAIEKAQHIEDLKMERALGPRRK
jgi:hypothetical protein